MLRDKTIAGAGLDVFDVFDVEPLPVDHPFRKLDTTVITPHLGYISQQNYALYYPDIVADIRGFLDGKPVRVIGLAGDRAGHAEDIFPRLTCLDGGTD